MGSPVELTQERFEHIQYRHPEVGQQTEIIAQVLADPDLVRCDPRFSETRLFSRWLSGAEGGRFVVVAVVSEISESKRHWIVTAYMTRRLTQRGEIEWKRG